MPASSDRFPQRLATLGYTTCPDCDGLVIIPPLCDIPAGPFLMGSDNRRDPQAIDNELPQHPIVLAVYQIARYPVTVAEYACAVRIGARPQPPDTWELTWEQQLERLDYPVVNVSWHGALVYAAWLAQITGQPWRLPTEAEWEKAARGTDGRIYPWGDVWDTTRPKMSEGDLMSALPIEAYPNGASPYGAQDMAGNVYEWTSSFYRPYSYPPAVSEDTEITVYDLVLRGTPLSNNPKATRTAHRLRWYQANSDSFTGFRIARGKETEKTAD